MGGFRHHHTKQELREYMKLSARQKLEWLEDVNRFLHDSMSPQAKMIAAGFRNGEVKVSSRPSEVSKRPKTKVKSPSGDGPPPEFFTSI